MIFKFVTMDMNWCPGWVAVVVAGMGDVSAGQNLMGMAGISSDSSETRYRRLQWILKF
jgi:hypothetical protein